MALVGFNNIRNMALSLVLLEHMHDKAHAAHLKEEFLRSLMAGMLASELGTTVPGSEEAYLGALFQNLGRLLTAFYFPEEAHQVRGIVSGGAAPGQTRVSDAVASVRVLGLSFETLGLGVAKSWGLPATLQACMRTPSGEPPTRPPNDGTDRLRWLTYTANRIADTLLHAEPEHAKSEVAAVAKRYAKALGLSPERIEAASATAREKLAQAVDAMSLQVPKQSHARRLFALPTLAATPDVDLDLPTLREDADHTARTQAARTLTLVDATVREARAADTTATPLRAGRGGTVGEDPCAVLTAGIEDITITLIDTFKLDDVLRMILETMYRALAFRHVVFCLRDVKSGALTGRFGFGEGVDTITAAFRVPMKGSTDLFSAVCAKGADVFIADTRAASIASRLPPWYVQRVDAPAFLLLPVFLGGAPLGLIYADRDKSGGSDLGERELSLLRTLRNQALMAFKQAG